MSRTTRLTSRLQSKIRNPQSHVPHRILHIIPSLDRAGAEKQLALLAAGLSQQEFDVHVCALTRGGPIGEDLQSAGIPYTVIGKRWKVDPLAYSRLRKHVASLRPDLVQTWIFAAGAYGRSAARSVGVRRIVHSERCVDRWKSPRQWAIDRHLARSTDRIIANSCGVGDYCASHGLPVEKLSVIPNAVEPARPSNVSRETLLDELAIPHDARLIGVVGRLWPQKRVRDLIWAYELVVVLHKTTRLLVVGDGPERCHLERFARRTSNFDRVRFLGERNDVWRIMPHLDVLWNGSGYEGMPNAVMEAMAAGIPVVATDIPGNRDLVLPGETGYLAPVSGRAEFTRISDRILSDATHAHSLGAAAKRRIEEEFTTARMVGRYGQMYRELLG